MVILDLLSADGRIFDAVCSDELPIFKLNTNRRQSVVPDDVSDPGPPPPEDDGATATGDDVREAGMVPVKVRRAPNRAPFVFDGVRSGKCSLFKFLLMLYRTTPSTNVSSPCRLCVCQSVRSRTSWSPLVLILLCFLNPKNSSLCKSRTILRRLVSSVLDERPFVGVQCNWPLMERSLV